MISNRWFLGKVGSFIIIFLVACTPYQPEPSAPTQTTISPTQTQDQHTQPAHENNLISPPLTPHTPGRSPSTTTQFYLDVELNYEKKQLLVDQTISYTNTTSESITDLPLLVPPAYRKGVFSLHSVKLGKTPIEADINNDALINLELNPPLKVGQNIEISLKYQLRLSKGAQALGYTERQLLLADWYPMIPYYQEGVRWIINRPGKVGEHLVYPLSDFHLNLCLVSNSKDLVVAASAPLSATHEDCLLYTQKKTRNMTLAISPYYQVVTITDDLVTINAYTFPEHAELGFRSAALSAQAWETFTNLFGDNQREFLSIVEADIFDGLEADGLFFLSDWYYQTADPSPQNFFELLVVHETAHQWFYGYIHSDQANEPWLDEALATYSEVLFYEIHHPELVNWWWHFRVAAYAPEGPVNADIYAFRQFRPYIDAVYLRGASFLQALRNEVGDQAFFEGLREYIESTDSDTLRTAADFFDAFSHVSNADLMIIKLEYFK